MREAKKEGYKEAKKEQVKSDVDVMEKPESKNSYNPLEKRTILVKPVIRTNRRFPESHSGNWQYDNTSLKLMARTDASSGTIIDPLTPKEREFFENRDKSYIHGLDFEKGDLSARKKKNNFWEKFSVKIEKSGVGPMEEDDVLLELDLSKPFDYFKYKVLLANDGPKGMVAGSESKKNSRTSNRIMLVEKNAENKVQVDTFNKESRARKFLYSIDNSAKDMYNFLRAFKLLNKSYNEEVPKNQSADWYKVEIDKLIKRSLNEVVSMIRDEDYYKKIVFVVEAVKSGLILIDRNGYYTDLNSEVLGQDMDSTIKKLQTDEKHDVYLQIKAQLEND